MTQNSKRNGEDEGKGGGREGKERMGRGKRRQREKENFVEKGEIGERESTLMLFFKYI